MELEILRLIYDYSIKGKLVDFPFVDKIIEIVVTKRNLDGYVKRVGFTDKLDKNDYGVACAAYNPLNLDILIDYESIELVMENRSMYDCLFHDFEQIMFRNLTITQIILHELEHAYQFKKLGGVTDGSIEYKLIKASYILETAMKNPKFLDKLLKSGVSSEDFTMYILRNRELYKRYYALNPTERLAQVNSFSTILNVLEPIKEHTPNLYEFKYASLVEQMLRGYEESWNEGICPTQVYLSGTRHDKTWSEFDFYDEDSAQLMENVSDQYTLSKRLRLGLPVTYKDYDTTNKWLHTTNKYTI